MEQVTQVIENKGEYTGRRNYATPVHEPHNDDMMDHLGEEATNRVAKEWGTDRQCGRWT
jgi:hypothetical protein